MLVLPSPEGRVRFGEGHLGAPRSSFVANKPHRPGKRLGNTVWLWHGPQSRLIFADQPAPEPGVTLPPWDVSPSAPQHASRARGGQRAFSPKPELCSHSFGFSPNAPLALHRAPLTTTPRAHSDRVTMASKPTTPKADQAATSTAGPSGAEMGRHSGTRQIRKHLPSLLPCCPC